MLLVPMSATALSLVRNAPQPGTPLVTPVPELEGHEVWRYREVDLDLDALYDAAEPLAPDPTVTLNLFDDATFEATFEELQSVPDIEAEVWSGFVDGDFGSGTAVFVIDPADGKLMANIRVDGHLFRIHSNLSNGRYHLAQLHPDYRPAGMGDSFLVPYPDLEPIDPVDPPPVNLHAEIEVKLVHDAATSQGVYFGFPAAVALAETNLIFISQGNLARLINGGLIPSTYSSQGTEQDLYWLTASSYATTDRGTADLVMLVVDDADFCGIAFLGDGRPRSDEVFTAVVVESCATGNLSLSHELGHNLSACHDPYVADCSHEYRADRHGHVASWTTTAPCPWYVPAVFCTQTRGVRSVMAYASECSDGGFECPRVPVFSDPNFMWNYDGGITVGPWKVPMGDVQDANNNSVIGETSRFVEDYR